MQSPAVLLHIQVQVLLCSAAVTSDGRAVLTMEESHVWKQYSKLKPFTDAQMFPSNGNNNKRLVSVES